MKTLLLLISNDTLTPMNQNDENKNSQRHRNQNNTEQHDEHLNRLSRIFRSHTDNSFTPNACALELDFLICSSRIKGAKRDRNLSAVGLFLL